MSRPGPWVWWSMQPFEDNEPERVPWWRRFVRMWNDLGFYRDIFTNVLATGLVAVLAYAYAIGAGYVKVSQRQADTAGHLERRGHRLRVHAHPRRPVLGDVPRPREVRRQATLAARRRQGALVGGLAVARPRSVPGDDRSVQRRLVGLALQHRAVPRADVQQSSLTRSPALHGACARWHSQQTVAVLACRGSACPVLVRRFAMVPGCHSRSVACPIGAVDDGYGWEPVNAPY